MDNNKLNLLELTSLVLIVMLFYLSDGVESKLNAMMVFIFASRIYDISSK